jgi:hypothetical protein
MRNVVLGFALASLSVGCSDDGGSRHLPPETQIDDKPAAITNQTHVRITFHAEGIANRFTCQLDGNAAVACTSPFEADVTDGDHAFQVAAALDTTSDGTPATTTWKVDTVAPDTTILSAPPALDNATAPELTFSGSDNNGTVTFECALDDAAFAACTSPATVAVSDGDHHYRVRAVDAAGNVDPSPATTAWRVDSTAPETTITAGPTAGSTTAAGVSFSFSSPDSPVSFECALDSPTFAPCTSPAAFTLGDGAHTFAARAKDEVGLVDPSPAMRAWTVDATAPNVAITATPANPSNGSTATFDFASADPTATFACQVDAGAFATCAPGFTSAALADGSHTFTVRATDPVGNAATAAFTWIIDTVPPTATITSGPPAATASTSATFAFITAGAPVAIECSLDGGAFAACTSPVTVSGLGEASHTFVVRATDDAGNRGSDQRTWSVDTTPPSVTITSGPTNPTGDSTPSVAFTVTGATAIDCRTDGGAFATCSSPFTTAALADGSHTITVRGTDAVGNAATASQTFTVDTVAPVVTVTPVASPTNNTTPPVTFTVTGGATQIQCQVDTGAFATCASPFTPAALADGSHTITVRATDAAGNPGTGATTFTVDGTPPPLAFDDTPPAQWPVNYFDMKFHTTDASATVACSLNGAAFTACTSPLTITTTYNVGSTFSVRARDPVGNVTTISTNWTSSNGLVLHYPWEQGQTHNTSLLAQNPAYSPDGTVSLAVTGGWAGTAAAAPAAHTYRNTIRALSSSADGTYTASVWVRVAPGSNGGTIFSTLTGNNGISLSLAGTVAILTVNENAKAFTTSADISPNQWVQLGLLTTGPSKGLQLLVNGVTVASVTPPTVTGFGPGQAPDLTVGQVFDVDVDDLRFYNRALSSSEICSTLVRGQLGVQGACVPLIPGFELDFERGIISDTGNWGLPLTAPRQVSFPPSKLGAGLRLSASGQPFSYTSGFANRITGAPGHSFSFWFVAGSSASDTLIDFLHACSPTAAVTCGIRVSYSTTGGLLVVANGGAAAPFSQTIPIPNGAHSVVITEQKVATGAITQSLSIYVDGVVTVLPIGTVNVYAAPSDSVQLPTAQGTQIDEYEFWPRDLSLDPEMLCENGWDGEWNPATGVCLLTSN